MAVRAPNRQSFTSLSARWPSDSPRLPSSSNSPAQFWTSEQKEERSVIDSSASIAAIGLTVAALSVGPLRLAVAQPPSVEPDEIVLLNVRRIYDRGLRFLASSQSPDGTWDGGKPGPDMTKGLENVAKVEGSW